MTLTLIESPWWLLLVLPLAAVIAWWMYRKTKGIMPEPARWGLMGLRFLSLCIIGWLLLQPILRALRTVTYPPIVAFLQDDSESLVIQSDSAYVRDVFPGEMQAVMEQLTQREVQVDGYRFGTDLSPGLSPDSLRFEAEGTNIAKALRETQKFYQNLNLGAVVLMSDGIVTSGASPLYQLEALGVPVYTVLLGDTTAQRDVRIRETLFNEIAYLNTEMPVKVRVQVEDYDQANLQVLLQSKGKTLASQPLRLGNNRPQGEVDFLVKPTEVGLQAFEVSVTRLDGEVTYLNNAQRFFVNVLETRVKIALFAGAPHPDLGALIQAFDQEEGYEVSEFLLRAPGKFYNDIQEVDLKDYDLIILHNFPASSADQEVVGRISTVIESEKIPLMAFVGTGADLRTMQPLYKWLAATPQNLSPRGEEIILNFSQDYRKHSTYTFDDRWISWANAAPPLFRPQAAWQAKADVEVFATAKIKNIPLDYPVYALQNYLGRKNMIFLGENIWRMRAHSYLEEEDFERFDAWLFNNIKWLMVSDDKRKFRVEPTKKVFAGRENVSFRGQAYDDSYLPIPGVEISVSLVDPQGKETTYYLAETRENQYFLDMGSLPSGTYRFQAEGRKDNVLVGKDRGEFSVGRSGVEHITLRADQDLLKQMAIRSGGNFLHARELPSLLAQLSDESTLVKRRDTRPVRTPFRQLLWPLLVLLCLLSAEWIIRKVNSQV